MVTLNREDFELIRKVLRFEFTEPWPEFVAPTDLHDRLQSGVG